MKITHLGPNITKATTYKTKHGNKKEESWMWVVGEAESGVELTIEGSRAWEEWAANRNR